MEIKEQLGEEGISQVYWRTGQAGTIADNQKGFGLWEMRGKVKKENRFGLADSNEQMGEGGGGKNQWSRISASDLFVRLTCHVHSPSILIGTLTHGPRCLQYHSREHFFSCPRSEPDGVGGVPHVRARERGDAAAAGGRDGVDRLRGPRDQGCARVLLEALPASCAMCMCLSSFFTFISKSNHRRVQGM